MPSPSGRPRSSSTTSTFCAASDHLARVDDVLGLDAVALEAGEQRLGDRRVVLDHQHLHAHIVARQQARSTHVALRSPAAAQALLGLNLDECSP